MSYKLYNHSLEFIDCPYDETLQKEVEAMVHKIQSRSGSFHVKYELEIEWNGTDAVTITKSSNGLTSEEENSLKQIESYCLAAVRKNGKGKVKNEAEVEKEV